MQKKKKEKIIPALGRQRQADLCEDRNQKLQRNPVSKIKKKERKEKEMGKRRRKDRKKEKRLLVRKKCTTVIPTSGKWRKEDQIDGQRSCWVWKFE